MLSWRPLPSVPLLCTSRCRVCRHLRLSCRRPGSSRVRAAFGLHLVPAENQGAGSRRGLAAQTGQAAPDPGELRVTNLGVSLVLHLLKRRGWASHQSLTDKEKLGAHMPAGDCPEVFWASQVVLVKDKCNL